MNVPNTPSLAFLVWLIILLPWMAWRSAAKFRAARTAADGQSPPSAPLPSRMHIWAGTLFLQVLLLAFAWMAARTFDYSIFSWPGFRARDAAAAAGAFVACMILRQIVRMIRNEQERRNLSVYAISPRTAKERQLRTLTVLITAIAEEAAYRGVAVQILWYMFGSIWPAVTIASIAFSLAHAMQGFKSMLIILGFALVAHALVQFTGTLVYAIIVHVAYDLVAGVLISRDVSAMERPAAIGNSA